MNIGVHYYAMRYVSMLLVPVWKHSAILSPVS